VTALPPQPNFFTLACADVERMTRFLRELGWPESPDSDANHRVFQCTNGLVFALYAAANYEPHYGPRADGFRGVEALEEPFDSPHGFRGFSFRDPEGNIWGVAWKRGSTVTAVGDLTWS